MTKVCKRLQIEYSENGIWHTKLYLYYPDNISYKQEKTIEQKFWEEAKSLIPDAVKEMVEDKLSVTAKSYIGKLILETPYANTEGEIEDKWEIYKNVLTTYSSDSTCWYDRKGRGDRWED